MSPRRTAVAAPAQEPDIDAMIQAISEWPLADLARFNSRLEELLLARRTRLQQYPGRRAGGSTPKQKPS